MKLRWCIRRGLLHQYVAGVTACLSIVTSGSTLGWITPLLGRLLSPGSDISLTSSESSLVASILELGGFIGPFPAGYVINRFGRKPAILAVGPLYILTWLAVLVWPRFWVLATARFFQGFFMGLPFTGVPIYLGEIASGSIRGSITSLFFIFFWLGFIISFSVGPTLSFTAFTWFTLSLNVPFFLLFLWQPETPHYCIMTGELNKAHESLRWFRDSSDDELQEELEEIKKSVEAKLQRRIGHFDLVATSANQKALALLMSIAAIRTSSGSGTFQVYATQILNATPNLNISADLVTVSFGVVMLVGSCVSFFTSDIVGRRALLLISTFACFCCTFVAGTFYLLYNIEGASSAVVPFSWLIPTLILVYAGFCSTGVSPVYVAYTSELFTIYARGTASSFGTSTTIVATFICVALFQPLTNLVGLCANFYFFSLTTLIGFIFFYFVAPETKGKSFVQIRNEFLGTNI